MSITIENLTKAFDKKVVLDNFSRRFPSVGVFALIGESGIGKTTLLRLIAGLDKRYSGKIVFDGDSSVSYAFQEHRLFPALTALENVFFANFDKKNEAELDLCKKALLDLGFTERDTELYPSELSGGMRQRVSLARAFVNTANVLLLDEPTKELDETNRSKVIEMIKKQAESRLVIMVTHDMEDALAVGAEIIHIK